MISFSPIISEPQDVQMQYYTYLRKLVRLVKWDHRKFAKAQLQFYKQKLCATNEPPKTTQFDFNCRFCYLLPFDLTMICCFSQKITKTEKLEILIKQIVGDFLLPDESRGFLASLFRAAQGENDAWDKVLCSELIGEFQDYLELFRKNLTFMKEKPYPILITATMSAGKSTLINALV